MVYVQQKLLAQQNNSGQSKRLWRFMGAVIGGSGSQFPFRGLSKRKLGKALLACPYAIATGGSSSLRGYFGALKAF